MTIVTVVSTAVRIIAVVGTLLYPTVKIWGTVYYGWAAVRPRMYVIITHRAPPSIDVAYALNRL